jgi:hypothetical protein
MMAVVFLQLPAPFEGMGMAPSPSQILMATVIRMFLSQDKLVLIKSLKTLYQ